MITGTSILLHQYIETEATVKDKELIEKMIHFYMGEYDRVMAQSNGASAIYSLYDQIDQVIKENYKDRIFSCKRGCYFCCQHHVSITEHEADLILYLCKRNSIPIQKRQLHRQQHHDMTNWIELMPKDRSCVFLSKTNSCKIYEFRPLMCRKHFSAGNPKDCHISETKKIPLGFDVHVESIISAAINKSPSDSMAKQLLKADKRARQSKQ